MRTWGRENFPQVDGEKETAKFVDHFRAQPGQRGVKTDWLATWRNWIRRAAESYPSRPAPGSAIALSSLPRLSTTDQRVAEAEAAGERVKAMIYGGQP